MPNYVSKNQIRQSFIRLKKQLFCYSDRAYDGEECSTVHPLVGFSFKL